MNKGLLIVVSAPSGCGKGTVLHEILKDDSFYCSVSATTRKPREGEINGVNYYFLSKEELEHSNRKLTVTLKKEKTSFLKLMFRELCR